MNDFPQSGWQGRARGFAWTVLFVVIALTFAIHTLATIAPTIVTVLVIGTGLYVGVVSARHRRSRW